MTTIEKKSLRVGKYVDTNHVDTIIRNYKQERWVHNSERLGKEDSMSVWYSVEELEEFISKIKDYGADGIRFYFGAYPNNHISKKGEDGRQTIVLVATKNKETKNGSANKDVYITTEKGTEILAYNMGGVCPPNYCPSGSNDDGWGGIGVTLVDRGDKGLSVI